MSFTCNECRIKNKQEHGLGWPFMGLSWGRCEDCGKTTECEDLHSRGSRIYDPTTGLSE
jgi:hypothetical protein